MEGTATSPAIEGINYYRNLPVPYFSKKIKMRIFGDKILLLDINEIVYFFAHGKHADILHIDGSKERIFHSLADLERLIPDSSFIRVGRSYLINPHYIYKIDIRKRNCTLRFYASVLTLENLSERAIKALTRNENFQASI